jgi:hypothetical protein
MRYYYFSLFQFSLYGKKIQTEVEYPEEAKKLLDIIDPGPNEQNMKG